MPSKRKFPRKTTIYAIRDGGSYRGIYTPTWRPGMPADNVNFYGYWSAYFHEPDGSVRSCHVNLSNCNSFAEVERKIRKWHKDIPIHNAHEAGDSYVD